MCKCGGRILMIFLIPQIFLILLILLITLILLIQLILADSLDLADLPELSDLRELSDLPELSDPLDLYLLPYFAGYLQLLSIPGNSLLYHCKRRLDVCYSYAAALVV